MIETTQIQIVKEDTRVCKVGDETQRSIIDHIYTMNEEKNTVKRVRGFDQRSQEVCEQYTHV